MENRITSKNEDFQIFNLLAKYMRYWPWFMLSVVVCCGAAFLYIKSTPVTYKRGASVMIKENSDMTDISAAFSDKNQFQSNVNVNNEIEAFKSPYLLQEVVRRLNLNVDYTIKDKLREVELYSQSPIKVQFPGVPDQESFSFYAELIPDDTTVILSRFERPPSLKMDRNIKVRFNDTVATPVGNVMIVPTSYFSSDSHQIPIKVTKNLIEDVADNFAGQLEVSLSGKQNTVIILELTDVSIERAEDFLNTLMMVYDENWLIEKNKVAVNTLKFINERLPLIEQELGGIDSNMEQYKTRNLLPDVRSAASFYMKESGEYSGKVLEVRNQISIAEYIKGYLNDTGKASDLLPTNTGLTNSAIESLIGQYNTLQLKRNGLIANSSEKNPIVMDMDNSLRSMRQSIVRTIDNLVVTLNLQLSNLRAQEAKMTQNIASNPGQEKHLSSIEREQKIKESLYLYLLQKREENEMLLAMTMSNTRIISPASGSNSPFKPKKYVILLMALMVGCGIPGGIIWSRDTLNVTVRGKKDLESLSVPFLGVIPSANTKEGKKNILLVRDKGRDVINESFRIIRTNLDTMCSKGMKVVLYTSLEPGSGKTFTAMNLAMSFALGGKKVALLDLDLRRATLSRFVTFPELGINNYLNGQIEDASWIIVKDCFYPGFDMIPSGPVSPNPTELLLSSRLKTLLDKLRSEYDYVFIDSTPVDLVADAAIVGKFSDLAVFVIRESHTDRRKLPELEKMQRDKKFKNIATILNASNQDISTGKYGTYYVGKGKDTNMLPNGSAYGGITPVKKAGLLTAGTKSGK